MTRENRKIIPLKYLGIQTNQRQSMLNVIQVLVQAYTFNTRLLDE